MKKLSLILLGCLGLCLPGYALTFVASEPVPATNKDLLHIIPRLDLQEDPGAVLFIKTDILNVSIRGHVISVPRRVNEGYVLFVPQGTKQLILNAPLYATQQITFPPLQSGKYYEMTLRPLETKEEAQVAEQRSKQLNWDQERVSLSLQLDYMELSKTLSNRLKNGALVYLDKRLNFTQWKQLLMPNGPYRPFDVSGNEDNPCCLVVKEGAPLESVFRMKLLDMDSRVENFDAGSTYHATLFLPSYEK